MLYLILGMVVRTIPYGPVAKISTFVPNLCCLSLTIFTTIAHISPSFIVFHHIFTPEIHRNPTAEIS